MAGADTHAGLGRRQVLGGIALGALLPALGGLAAPLHAAELDTEGPGERETSAALLRQMFPHAAFAPAFYDEMAGCYLEELAARPDALAEHRRGLALLDASYIAPFAQLPAVIQRALVARVDQEPFFTAYLMRGAELVYRDARVWDRLGYEGSSVEYGGYLDRGFDDIDWLPGAGEMQ
ncbi:hypothetical protein [Novosphingobium sp. MBES04]|uniref:hypothetical protein n=1 Tax=Novosphingobium sp. MBES04 TaxID=1206458 RepID=UPI000694136D|nr:hypothetical protein [Novosphingobium sp. MBES04]GAM04218.1 hypothetical conserved protein [Novosphingobium sp. MBES04]